MKSLVLSLCACFVFSGFAQADECSAAKARCAQAKSRAGAMAISNYGDVERNRDVFRAQSEADRVCGEVWGICEAERRREEERKRANARGNL